MQNTYDNLKKAVIENADATEAALTKILNGTDEDYGLVYDAERYSVLGGGKRVRPFIVNECCKMLGGDVEKSMPLACAMEMIHTYSLIHDDLPCMDDDDIRRGKPSNHKEFGYANALLAGDALLTGAFKVIAEADTLDASVRIEAIKLLSEAAGERGMIGGQIMDLIGETQEFEFKQLLKLHSHKTAALMECSAKLGALAAGYATDSEQSKAVAAYAKDIGVAFQVVDDILDCIADEAELGKPVKSDEGHNKTTFMTFYTAEEAQRYAEELTAEAISALSIFENSELLTDFACYLLQREN